MDARPQFEQVLQEVLQAQQLTKLTLSKPRSKQADLRNVFARLIELKGQVQLSCTFRYKHRDETKNYALATAAKELMAFLAQDFFNADLFTQNKHYAFQSNKKGKSHLRQAAFVAEKEVQLTHDHQKNRPLKTTEGKAYLSALGIANKAGKILQQGQKKFRQINKYIEIISHLLKEHPLKDQARIVDMGSGKGYLTFALYDYLKNEQELQLNMTGIELRPKLVDYCNSVAADNAFDTLSFVAQDIHAYQPTGGIDMLIALHACDTATDEAIAKGINAQAEVIVVAPCCQKQVRKDMSLTPALKPMLKHGILLERQAVMLTDSIRALVLEAYGYKTKVFEFISTEHTPKNLMITASKAKARPEALEEIKQLMELHAVKRHHLLELLKEKGQLADKG